MSDDILTTLRDQREKAIEQRTLIKRKLEDLGQRIGRLNDQVQEFARQRRDLSEPYKVATEQVADLTEKIENEERRRQEEAAAARAAQEAAVQAQAAADKAKAEEAAKTETQVITSDDVGELEP